MTKIINILFWTIWTAAFLISLLRSFLFSNTIVGQSEIDLVPITLVLCALSIFIILFRRLRKETRPCKTDKVFYILSLATTATFLILKIINRLVSSEFVLNKLNIQPNNLIWPALIALFPVAVILLPRINLKKLFKIQSAVVISIFLIVSHGLYTIYKSHWQTYQFIITHPFVSYDEKMRKAIGEFSYNYAKFIVKYTPESATLLVPPQAFPWPSSGNIGYFRYFSYPRTLIAGDEFIPPPKDIFAGIDYVLLNWGETERVENEHTHGWPKFDVKAEKIIFMDEDGGYAGELKGNYHYKDYKDKKVWGLIVIKH